MQAWDIIPEEINSMVRDGYYTIIDTVIGKVTYNGETWEEIKLGD